MFVFRTHGGMACVKVFAGFVVSSVTGHEVGIQCLGVSFLTPQGDGRAALRAKSEGRVCREGCEQWGSGGLHGKGSVPKLSPQDHPHLSLEGPERNSKALLCHCSLLPSTERSCDFIVIWEVKKNPLPGEPERRLALH